MSQIVACELTILKLINVLSISPLCLDLHIECWIEMLRNSDKAIFSVGVSQHIQGRGA